MRAHILQNLVRKPVVVIGANSFKEKHTLSTASLCCGPLLLALGTYAKVKVALLMLN